MQKLMNLLFASQIFVWMESNWPISEEPTKSAVKPLGSSPAHVDPPSPNTWRYLDPNEEPGRDQNSQK
jgi:hypothetical protein